MSTRGHELAQTDGVPRDATLNTIAIAGGLEAIILDPVYSGKELAGLLSMIEAGRRSLEDEIVFVHTGRTPAVFAYGDISEYFWRELNDCIRPGAARCYAAIDDTALVRR